MSTIHIFKEESIFSEKTQKYTEIIAPHMHYYYFENKIESQNKNIQIVKNKNEIINLIDSEKISHLVFHGLQYYQLKFIESLRKKYTNKIQISWMFWSYEYYQLHFNIKFLYGNFSSRYKFRKKVSLIYENLIHFIRGNVSSPFLMSKKDYFKKINLIDNFYSLVEDDYLTIFQTNSLVRYQYLSYVDTSDMHINTLDNESKEEKIMIGHNGSPILNHIEILDVLNLELLNFEILLPLSYGKEIYIKSLKKYIAKNLNLKITYLENKLPIDKYYSLLSEVKFFFLNSYCQQGLGNVLFFLLNGVSVYLSTKSSTYKFLKRKGLIVFSIEEFIANKEMILLDDSQKKTNKTITNSFLNSETVLNQWSKL